MCFFGGSKAPTPAKAPPPPPKPPAPADSPLEDSPQQTMRSGVNSLTIPLASRSLTTAGGLQIA